MVELTRPTGRKALRSHPPGMPETNRLVAVSKESQPIGEFLEWLATESGYVLGRYDDDLIGGDHRLYPVHVPIERLLALYYGIDLDRVSRERQRLLVWMHKRGDA